VGCDLGFELEEARLIEADAIHFVDDHRHLRNAKQMKQVAVSTGLIAQALGGVDDEHRGVGLRGAGDHVAQELGMAGRIDQHDIARGSAEADLAGVERDALIAFGLQRVEEERPLECHTAPVTHRLQRFQFAVGQTFGFMQQPADQRRFAVVDMARDHDAN
jgi:hypothetical protein